MHYTGETKVSTKDPYMACILSLLTSQLDGSPTSQKGL